ncbi:Metallo-hydrolase/oxidoreductase [Aspergillus ambiguus]|uniref:alkyl/aryl-sulfatase n=1 Tax=Aspergillus ambiguus TaxID=176160 RepID=UPI003CCE25EC
MTAHRPFDEHSPSFEDRADFENADRGFIASLNPCVIKNARGKTVWNNDEHNYVNQQRCPTTVNPMLWRQAQLLSKQGLYKLTPSIYQVRGFDISHITFVEGQSGIIVIDPLVSCECAAEALKLYQTYRGVRSIKAIIYSHSHIDHYGGAAGLLPSADQGSAPADIPIIAPEGFMEEAISENVFAGPIMRYRSKHMYGSDLPRSPVGQIGVGLGMGTSRGRTSLLPPTVDIENTGQTLAIDNVRIVFQMVPNTEAPAEMNMYFPDERALLVAECATHGLHNITTLRGALVRDAKAWSRYLDETLMLFCEDAQAEVLFGSHGWPTWGNSEARTFLAQQRDLYGYLHDQTVKQMNEGWNGTEIAERIVLPPNLRRAWHTQDFYGSISHNVKGIYQRYMTWFDGSGENLWKWPPLEEGCRYVRCMGGPEEVLAKAKLFIEEGDLRFAATLLGHLVAAGDQAGNTISTRYQAREMLASVFEQLGFGTENATWRNLYLSQAAELRSDEKSRTQKSLGTMTFPPTLSVEEWFGGLSICIDGNQAGKEKRAIYLDIDVQDIDERWLVILSNGVLTYRRQDARRSSLEGERDLAVNLTKAQLQGILIDGNTKGVRVIRGDIEALEKVLSFAGIGKGKAVNRL